jgi:hypothetical protein
MLPSEHTALINFVRGHWINRKYELLGLGGISMYGLALRSFSAERVSMDHPAGRSWEVRRQDRRRRERRPSTVASRAGLKLPKRRLSTKDLLDSCPHRPRVDLERLTGIRERRVWEGEDSFTLAVDAAWDCLAHLATAPKTSRWSSAAASPITGKT